VRPVGQKERLKMNINDMTIGEAKQIASMFGTTSEHKTPHIGKKCIIRTYASGVHFGEIIDQSGRQVELKNARRLWRWDAAPNGISLSEIAIHGPTGDRSRICQTVPYMTILDALEIIPTSDVATKMIENYKATTP